MATGRAFFGVMVAFAAAFWFNNARADDALCAQRPGQTTPPCIAPGGQFIVETGLADWSVQSDADQRADTLSFGQTQLRWGIGGNAELQLVLPPYVRQRARDRATGAVGTTTGFADPAIGVEHRLSHGKFAASIDGLVTLPIGAAGIGQGDWGAAIKAPIAWQPRDGIEIDLTPEIDAVPNGDSAGHHLVYGGAVGIPVPLGDKVTLGLDLSAFRDEDPAGAVTRVKAGGSVAFRVSNSVQFDIGGVAGLDANSPDVELYCGIAFRL